MASKLAEQLLEKIDQGDGVLTALEVPEYEDLIDAELREVREVLFEVIREHDDPMSEYGCTTHTTQRARDLMEKLKP